MANKEFRVKHGLDIAEGKLIVATGTGAVSTEETLSIGNKLTVVSNGADITGLLTAKNDAQVDGDLTVVGDLTVSGTTVSIDTTNLVVEDAVIKLAKNNSSGSVDYIGLQAERGAIDAYWIWEESTDRWRAVTSPDGTTYTNADIQAASFRGNLVGNVTGQVSDLSNFSTTNLSEGTNLYFTDTRSKNTISVTDSGGDGSLAYNSSTGVITYTGPNASEVRAHLSASGDPIAYNTTTGVITWAGDTDDVDEGSTNRYYTDTRVRSSLGVNSSGDIGTLSYNSTTGVFDFAGLSNSGIRGKISVTDAGGDGSLAYNSTTGVITYTGPSAAEVRAHLSASANDGLNYSSGNFTLVQDIRTSGTPTFNTLTTSGNITAGGVVIGGLQGNADTATNFSSSRTVSVTGDVEDMGSSSAAGTHSLTLTVSDNAITFAKMQNLSAMKVLGSLAGGDPEQISFLDEDDMSSNSATSLATQQSIKAYVAANASLTNFSALQDTTVTSPTDGHISIYDDTADKWKNKAISGDAVINKEGVLTVQAGAIENSMLDNNSLTVLGVDGLSGGGTVALGGSISLALRVDNSSIEVSNNIGRVKVLGITNAMLAGSIADGKLASDYIKITEVDDSSIEFDSGTLNVKTDGIKNSHIDWGTGADQPNSSTVVEAGANLYFTEARARSSISYTDNGGDGSLTYNSNTGKITYTGPSSTEARAHFSANHPINFNSSTGVITWVGDTDEVPEGDNLYHTDARVHASRLDQMASPSFNLSMNSKKIINLADGVNDNDAVNKSQLDATLSGGSLPQLADVSSTLNSGLTQHMLLRRGGSSWEAGLLVNSNVASNANIASSKIAELSNFDTGDLSQGSNLYYTDALVQANRLDEMAAPNANVSWNSKKIINLADGTAANDAINKSQLDGHNHAGVYSPVAHTHGIDNLTDVDTSTTAPEDGQALIWDNGNSKWEPGVVSGNTLICQDDAPDSPNVGDMWYETDRNIFYTRIQDSAATQVWLDLSTAGGDGSGILTCQNAPPSNPNVGDTWYETDRNIFYTRIEDSAGTQVWVDLSTAGSDEGGWTNSGTNTVEITVPGDSVGIGVTPVEILTIDGITALKEQTSTPSVTAGYAKIYSKEVSGNAEMFVLDEANNETQISPHNPAGEWEYYSENKITGKRVRINMERMIRKLEEITGETFIEYE